MPSCVILPSNEALGLEPVHLLRDPSEYTIHEPLTGLSEDALRLRAEGGEWDLYETCEIDAPTLSLTALRNRFLATYSGELIDTPGAFIEEVLRMQRQLPNTSEFAAELARQGILSDQEAKLVQSDPTVGKPVTDAEFDAERAYYKTLYAANVTPGTLTPATIASTATEFAKRMTSTGHTATDRLEAQALLHEARGLDASEVAAAQKQAKSKTTPSDIDILRRYGIPLELAPGISSRHAPFMASYRSAQYIARELLSSESLDRQIAVRQFFGMQNLARFVVAQFDFEAVTSRRDVAFSHLFIANHLAPTEMVHTRIGSGEPFASEFTNEALAERLGLRVEGLCTLGSLATFAMHEPGLATGTASRDAIGSHTRDMVIANYRIYLDRQLARERADR